jgi:hypothetical protein
MLYDKERILRDFEPERCTREESPPPPEPEPRDHLTTYDHHQKRERDGAELAGMALLRSDTPKPRNRQQKEQVSAVSVQEACAEFGWAPLPEQGPPAQRRRLFLGAVASSEAPLVFELLAAEISGLVAPAARASY